MGFVFFKIPKAKKFRYQPFLYKEEMDDDSRLRRHTRENSEHAEFERELKQRWHRKDSLKRKSRGLTALVFLLLLIILLLWIIFL